MDAAQSNWTPKEAHVSKPGSPVSFRRSAWHLQVALPWQVRELIGVPARIERAMRAYTRAHPEEARLIEAAQMFRAEVGNQFERLVREGAPHGKTQGHPLLPPVKGCARTNGVRRAPAYPCG